VPRRVWPPQRARSARDHVLASGSNPIHRRSALEPRPAPAVPGRFLVGELVQGVQVIAARPARPATPEVRHQDGLRSRTARAAPNEARNTPSVISHGLDGGIN
jgi:hypothetical protein